MMNSVRNQIIFIDDNIATRDLLASQLRASGLDIMVSSEGFQALHLLENRNFDLVILTSYLADTSGLEILQLIRSRWEENELPIIYYDDEGDNELQVQFLTDGANDIVVKDNRPMNLINSIKKLLEIKSV